MPANARRAGALFAIRYSLFALYTLSTGTAGAQTYGFA